MLKDCGHLRSGVSNSNPLTGRISYQRCSEGHTLTLREKSLCGLQFLKEGSQGPNKTLFLHLYGFINNIFGKNSMKISSFQYNSSYLVIFYRNAGRIDTLGGPHAARVFVILVLDLTLA